MTDGLKAAHREAITAVIAANDRVERALLFGSRATGTNTVSSDVDLALFGERLTLTDQARLAADLDEIPMAQSVDLLLYDSIRDRTLREHIRQQGIEWYTRPTRDERCDTSSVFISGWPVVTVQDLSEKVAMGPFGSSIKVSTFVPAGVPIISGQHLHGVRVDDTPNFNFITSEHAARLVNANVHRGDVIFTHRGNIGQVAYIPENSRFERYVVSQSQFYVRCDRAQAIPEFIALYFTSPEGQHQLLANTSQVGVPSIAQPVTYLRTLQIPLPSLSEQRTIAHILGTLDDKIELNRRINAILEAMARVLFRSWFVDFDPVRAKMEGRDTGLPKEISDLFPDRLVDSELGEIPEGWRVGHVEDEFEIIMGQSPPGHTYNESGDGLPFFQGRSDFGFRYPKNRKFCTAPNRIAQPWDTIVSVRAPVGDINMAWERCCIGRGVAALRHRSGAVSFGYCTAQALQTHMREYEHTGTVFGAINRKQLARLPLQQPPADVVRSFERLVHPWDRRIRLRTAEVETLTALRGALLPKLVSGELRVNRLGPARVRDERSASVGTSGP